MTVQGGGPGMIASVVPGTGGAGGGGVSTPMTLLVARVAGRPWIITLGLPTVTTPAKAPAGMAPATASPRQEAGPPQTSTVGAPGPVIGQEGATAKSIARRD